MNADVISLEDVSCRLNGQYVLEHVNLSVREGDFYAIIGPNGGGKTTLLKVVLGLITPVSGIVRLLGGTPELMRDRCGYVPQFRTYDFRYPITVMDMVLSGNLGHIAGIRKRYRHAERERALLALEKVGLGELSDRAISNLSGGEQQRSIIARALVGDPRLLILDEPTVYVDAPSEVQLFSLLDELNRNMTIVYVTHDIGAISSRVTRVACLNRRLYTHDTREITEDMITAAYHCPIELIAHGIPHRVLREHKDE